MGGAMAASSHAGGAVSVAGATGTAGTATRSIREMRAASSGEARRQATWRRRVRAGRATLGTVEATSSRDRKARRRGAAAGTGTELSKAGGAAGGGAGRRAAGRAGTEVAGGAAGGTAAAWSGSRRIVACETRRRSRRGARLAGWAPPRLRLSVADSRSATTSLTRSCSSSGSVTLTLPTSEFPCCSRTPSTAL